MCGKQTTCKIASKIRLFLYLDVPVPKMCETKVCGQPFGLQNAP